MCWHRFLARVKEGDFNEEKVADLEETKRCTVLESADEVKEGEEDPDSTRILMIWL